MAKTRAIRIHAQGGPEELRFDEVDIGEPGAGEARIRQTAIGVNFIDVYHRTGLYPVPETPCVIGMEGAGVVEAVGPNVADLAVGTRVAYASPPLGAYAERRLMPADRLLPLPDTISDREAAAMMLKGMTAEYLLRRTYAVQPGDTILLHAAAGGVGTIASQWARHIGATVIGTVGTDEKADLAREHGCTHTIVYTRESFTDRVREITHGKGVPVVYDSVGKATFEGSLDCLSPRGMMVSFGNASGPVPPFNLATLSMKGSLYITRPTLMTYTASRAELLESANELFRLVEYGAVKIEIKQTYPLEKAAEAHRDLEARKTTGSILLIP